MPGKDTSKSVAAQEAQASAREEKAGQAAGNAAPKFKVEKLRAKCQQLFGVTSSTFDGAFYGNTETEMTIKEAEDRIKKWLGGKE